MFETNVKCISFIKIISTKYGEKLTWSLPLYHLSTVLLQCFGKGSILYCYTCAHTSIKIRSMLLKPISSFPTCPADWLEAYCRVVKECLCHSYLECLVHRNTQKLPTIQILDHIFQPMLLDLLICTLQFSTVPQSSRQSMFVWNALVKRKFSDLERQWLVITY